MQSDLMIYEGECIIYKSLVCPTKYVKSFIFTPPPPFGFLLQVLKMSVNNPATTSKETEGTVIITGANGSLGLRFVQHLLRKYPGYFAILAVRNDSDNDPNTLKLRQIVSRFDHAKISIEAVDLASFASVRSFADSISTRIGKGALPHISAIVCNAFSWSLIDQKTSKDGFDLGFQTSHLSHFLLVLKLISSMNKDTGRIVLLGSVQILTPKTTVNPFGANLPTNFDELVKPVPDKKGEEQAHGFQRYAWSKMANVMFMEMLNRKLLANPDTKNIVALATDPGDMPTSRCFKDAPASLKVLVFVAGNLILPVSKHFTNAIRTTDAAGADLVSMAVGPAGKGMRGYFIQEKPAAALPETRDKIKQEKLWEACEEWVGMPPTRTL